MPVSHWTAVRRESSTGEQPGGGQTGSNEAQGRPAHSLVPPIATTIAVAIAVGGIIWWFRRPLQASVMARVASLRRSQSQERPQVWNIFLTRPLPEQFLLCDLQVRLRPSMDKVSATYLAALSAFEYAAGNSIHARRLFQYSSSGKCRTERIGYRLLATSGNWRNFGTTVPVILGRRSL